MLPFMHIPLSPIHTYTYMHACANTLLFAVAKKKKKEQHALAPTRQKKKRKTMDAHAMDTQQSWLGFFFDPLSFFFVQMYKMGMAAWFRATRSRYATHHKHEGRGGAMRHAEERLRRKLLD